MKILMVCQIPLGQKSGAASRTISVIKSLKEEGHSVTLLSPSYEKFRGVLDVDVFYIPTSQVRYLWTFLWHFLSFFYIVSLYILKKPEIIYIRITHLSILQTLAAKILRIPFVCEIHADFDSELKVKGKSNLTIKITNLIVRIICQWSSKIIVVSPRIGENLIKKYEISKKKIHVVSNGVDTELFSPMDSRKAKKIASLDDRYEYITYTGIFAPWRGLEFLIKAVPLVAEIFPNVKFLLVGDGPERQKLENLANQLKLGGRVIFTGWVDYEKVSIYINCATVCVAPILDGVESGSSLKVFSYLACARPVVMKEAGGVDLVKEIGAGIVYQGDSAELAGALIEMLKNKELTMNMGKRGRKAVVKKYSWKEIVLTLVSIFEEALKN